MAGTGTGTGGFVFRAERSTLEIKSATTPAVGPGIYDPSAGVRSSNPAPAPFHTSNERNLMENTTTSAYTPGVGAYEAGTALDSLLNRRVDPVGSTAVFASGVQRLTFDKNKAALPGPGAYDQGNAWTKKSHRYSAPASRNRVVYQKVPSAPSIPAQHQSFGYEEGGNGELVLQKPQDPIHTGVGRDTVGPGSYSPPVAIQGGAAGPKAVAWGNSRSKRGDIVKSDVPGPGSYNLRVDNKPSSNAIVVSINGVDVQFGGASGTSNFASKVPLWSQWQPSDHQRTPGPGQYNPEAGKGGVKELNNFGANAPRFNHDIVNSRSAPTYMKNPGPGAYNDPRRSIAVNRSLADPQPFNTTANRFHNEGNGMPGPGEYKPEAVNNIVTDLQAKAAISRGGVFGTNAARFVSKADPVQAGLSPASYDPNPGAVKASAKDVAATAFVSKTQRFIPSKAPPTAVDYTGQGGLGGGTVRGDPARLGPGSYLEADPWVKKQRHPGYRKSAAFGSEAARNTSAPVNPQNPGPGRYNTAVDVNKVFKPFSAPAKDTVFGSQAGRFKNSASFTPGPGYYNQEGGAVVKKSFNVTYSGVEVA